MKNLNFELVLGLGLVIFMVLTNKLCIEFIFSRHQGHQFCYPTLVQPHCNHKPFVNLPKVTNGFNVELSNLYLRMQVKVTKCGYEPVSLSTVPKRLFPCYHWQLLFSSLLKIYDTQMSVITTWVVKHYGNVVWHLTFQVAIVVSWLWYII